MAEPGLNTCIEFDAIHPAVGWLPLIGVITLPPYYLEKMITGEKVIGYITAVFSDPEINQVALLLPDTESQIVLPLDHLTDFNTLSLIPVEDSGGNYKIATPQFNPNIRVVIRNDSRVSIVPEGEINKMLIAFS